MTPQQQILNTFLVEVFNDILRLEEASLRRVQDNVSVSELHVLEAARACAESAANEGEGAGMAEIAARLHVTSGTLTVAVKTLEQKGCLVRTRHSHDKRRVLVTLTQAAQPLLAAHDAFHTALVTQASQQLSPAQQTALAEALSTLHIFFDGNPRL